MKNVPELSEAAKKRLKERWKESLPQIRAGIEACRMVEPPEIDWSEISASETAVSARTNEKNPVAYLEDIDDRDLFWEIEREHEKPKSERRSDRRIAKELCPDSYEKRLKRIQRARRKAREA